MSGGHVVWPNAALVCAMINAIAQAVTVLTTRCIAQRYTASAGPATAGLGRTSPLAWCPKAAVPGDGPGWIAVIRQGNAHRLDIRLRPVPNLRGHELEAHWPNRGRCSVARGCSRAAPANGASLGEYRVDNAAVVTAADVRGVRLLMDPTDPYPTLLRVTFSSATNLVLAATFNINLEGEFCQPGMPGQIWVLGIFAGNKPIDEVAPAQFR